MMNGMAKHFSLEVEIKWSKDTEEHTWKDKAKMECSEETCFSDMVNFLDKVKKIVSRVKKAYGEFGEGASYNLTFCEYIYNYDDGKIVKSDCWKSERLGDVNEEGIYFVPDANNEEQSRDMYIGYAKPLEDLIYTLH